MNIVGFHQIVLFKSMAKSVVYKGADPNQHSWMAKHARYHTHASR